VILEFFVNTVISFDLIPDLILLKKKYISNHNL